MPLFFLCRNAILSYYCAYQWENAACLKLSWNMKEPLNYGLVRLLVFSIVINDVMCDVLQVKCDKCYYNAKLAKQTPCLLYHIVYNVWQAVIYIFSPRE